VDYKLLNTHNGQALVDNEIDVGLRI